MSAVTFFKPNAQNSGHAAKFYTNVHQITKKFETYLNIAKQVKWDPDKKIASFKSDDPDNKIAVKFKPVELASMILAIDEVEPFSTVHVYSGDSTSITFKSYKKKDSKIAFGLSISRKGAKFSISLNMNEALLLRSFCDQAINEAIRINEA